MLITLLVLVARIISSLGKIPHPWYAHTPLGDRRVYSSGVECEYIAPKGKILDAR